MLEYAPRAGLEAGNPVVAAAVILLWTLLGYPLKAGAEGETDVGTTAAALLAPPGYEDSAEAEIETAVVGTAAATLLWTSLGYPPKAGVGADTDVGMIAATLLVSVETAADSVAVSALLK